MASPPHDTPKRPQRGILSRGSSFLGAVTGDSDSVGDGLILLGPSRLAPASFPRCHPYSTG